ncbi:MAG TPA: MMPL family transporter [Acidimicrobiales bacterium]|jgi:RND superfamily putative drug exporter|nr:MMPL family transporter [Acidimicrobiales bacterium]
MASGGSGTDTGILERLARSVIKWRRAVLAGGLLIIIGGGIFGLNVGPHLSQGGFDGPSEPSSVASSVLEGHFHAGAPNVTVLVTARKGTVNSPAAAAAGLAITHRLEAERYVANVQSYWTLGSPAALRADGQRQAVIAFRIEGTQNQFVQREQAIAATLDHVPAGISVQLGGFAPAFSRVDSLIERGVLISEAIAVPLTMLLLLFVFGSVIAAAMPLTIAGVAVIGTLAILRLLSTFTEVSVFAENLTTALSFGLAIDYSLFVVSRYREELETGASYDEALTRAVSRAGRTVFGSALTVMAALAVLLVFPIDFLRSISLAGMAVAALAGLSALLVLPAALSALGPRINSFVVWRRSVSPPSNGWWRRTAVRVMRHPLPYAAAAITVLVFLATPIVGLRMGYLDDRVLPTTDHLRQTDDTLRREFGSAEVGAIQVVMPSYGSGPTTLRTVSQLYGYAERLSELPKVSRVETAMGFFIKGQHVTVPASYSNQYLEPGGTWFAVLPSVDPLSVQSESVVRSVRATPSPHPVLVGGVSAQFLDSTSVIESRMPLAFGLIAVVMFVILFMLFGSVVIPIKALLLNLLSLSATYGAMVWMFQDGHLSGLLNFTATGSLIAAIPVMMFCVAFGLSMDYEVFLISRIKEERDNGATNEEAIAAGLQRSGRIITAAALLMAVVFLSLVSNEISSIKLFAVGLCLTVLVDAFLIRGTLVPAFMKILGDLNWWAPAPMKRFHERRGLVLEIPEVVPAPIAVPQLEGANA